MEQARSTHVAVRADQPRHDSKGPKSLVCERCWNEIFDTDAYETICLTDDYVFEYTRSYKDIQTAALAECNWCRFIMSELIKNRAAETQVTIRFTGIDDPYRKFAAPKGQNTYHLFISVGGGRWEVHVFAYAHATDAAAKFVTSRKLQPNVSSDSAIDQYREWLNDCVSSHEQCRKPGATQLPTRVIDVAPGGGLDDARLLETRGLTGEYITLSYCWGNRLVGVLTSENIAAYYEQLDITALPRTLRDAVVVTRSLGIRFLWIDCLCIIQDSEQDKEKELSCMHRIYQDCVLTIVASSASSAEEGFLADRSNEDLCVLMERQFVDYDTQIDYLKPPSPSSTYEIPFRYDHGSMERMFVRTDYYRGDLFEPVNRRAWTLQEQLLSPRLLLYSSHTLQWRCRSGSRNLDDSLDISEYSYSSVKSLAIDECELPFKADNEEDRSTKQDREADIWNNWNDIIYQYSIGQASLPADKLVALGGVAEEFSKLTKCKYLAGLWENQLCEQLLWGCPGGPRRGSRPAQYRAPSWSWAAIDSPVRLVEYHADFERMRNLRTAKVVEFNVVLKSQTLPFGAVTDGFLKLKAARRLGRLCFAKEKSEPDQEKPRDAFVIWADHEMWTIDELDLTPKTTKAFRCASADLDALGHASQEKVECFVIRESSWGQKLEGLLLQRSEAGHYRRIGLFNQAEKAAFEHIKPEEIMII